MGQRTNTAKWVESRKRWQINVQKDGERKTFTCATAGRTGQRQANAKADAWLDDGIRGQTMRVSALWEIYLSEIQLVGSTTAYRNTKQVGDCYILPICGNIKISNITEGMLQVVIDKAYKNGCLKKDNAQMKPRTDPLSKKTLMSIRAIEGAFLKWCRKNNYTTLFPENLSIPKGARTQEKKILLPESIVQLFSTDTTLYYGKRVFDDYIYAYRFAVATGLRPGELFGLQVGDIHGTRVDVARSINRYGEVTQGKNDNAVRSFHMNSYAYGAYVAQMELLEREGFFITPKLPLFQIESQTVLYGHWDKFQRSNDIPHISLYEMRHTFVSVAKNLSDAELKSLVGHSKNMDTRGIYGHEMSGEAERTAQNVSDIFGKIIG